MSVFKKARLPSVPPGERIYAIGDIHGRIDLLDRLIGGIEREIDKAEGLTCRLVFLGDYVDRGPDSALVLDRMVALRQQFPNVTLLCGNHEEAMLLFMEDPIAEEAWLDFGGVETLESYRVPPPMPRNEETVIEAAETLKRTLPPAHLDLLTSLEESITIGDYFFVHAGIRPGIPLEEQARDDLLWIREEFIGASWSPGKIVVHGHTPSEEPSVGPWRIGIDTGAYATGRLTCVVLEDKERRFLATSPKRAAPRR